MKKKINLLGYGERLVRSLGHGFNRYYTTAIGYREGTRKNEHGVSFVRVEILAGPVGKLP